MGEIEGNIAFRSLQNSKKSNIQKAFKRVRLAGFFFDVSQSNHVIRFIRDAIQGCAQNGRRIKRTGLKKLLALTS